MRRLKRKTVDVKVSDLTDWNMHDILTRENATQRKDNVLSNLDAVASAVLILTRSVLSCESWKDWRTTSAQSGQRLSELIDTERAFDTARGHILCGSDGIGRPMIMAYFDAVLNKSLPKAFVTDALDQLKQSGEYARIVNGVIAETNAAQKRIEAARAGDPLDNSRAAP